MHLTRLHLTQFRNYPLLDLDFSPGVNIFTGDNGEGKTNILEAVHFLAMTRGFQSQGEKFSLQEGAPWFTVEGAVQFADGEAKVQCSYLPPRGKKMILNGAPVAKMSDHIGRMPLVSVLPWDTQLITEGPAVRRKFMDGFISQYDPRYLADLIAYEKAVEQRNALLNAFAERGGWDREQLELWEMNMITPGRNLAAARKTFIQEFEPVFAGWFHHLVSGKETPSLACETQLIDNTEAEWKGLFERQLDRDRGSCRTSVGVQKDDLIFIVNGQPVRDFGSQGQQKTFLLALRFAQFELLQRKKGTPPLLLLDDIFDKLDMHRLKAIATLLETQVAGQVFVTDTSVDRARRVFGGMKGKEVRFFQVKNGSVTLQDGKEK
jgi:DNA replication and repair protein RecF